jgi:hypothetical protein
MFYYFSCVSLLFVLSLYGYNNITEKVRVMSIPAAMSSSGALI